MDTGSLANKLNKLILSPPGIPAVLITSIGTLLVLIGVSVPGKYFLPLLFGSALLCGCVLVWMKRILSAARFVALSSHSIDRSPRTILRWAGVPIIVAVTILLANSGIPLHVAFSVSRPAMDDLVAQIQSSPSSTPPATAKVGLYPIYDIEADPNGIRFTVRRSGFLFCSSGGFAYSPNGPPAADAKNVYEHLSGPWYSWIQLWGT